MNITVKEMLHRIKRDEGIELTEANIKEIYSWYRKSGTGYKNIVFAVNGTADGILVRCAWFTNPIDDQVIYKKDWFA